ncbi:MFS transporter [Priestia filamentosa]|uniref:MFS transporter n=1 Tax=Priestia filamentosa TaxID=1402861 RepID=A0A1X7D9W9_9BACI|nr:MFS transporter [Priestia filamentosa]AKO93669.1 MFS transporter [Priestia filamentosa]MDT3763889.1 MFS transporter [Priestia filamentosa]OXS71631.1 MFS transporter [Priestia filamentosa]WCM14535.1 MFS transporter [Priestia filamentosa]WRU94302.1 MFS transporter [Priestia filamentosa]
MKKNNPALVIFLFFLGWVFMYADRNILSPVMSDIGREWNLNQTELGLMSTVFFASYAFMQIPTGFLADKFGRVRVLVTGYIIFGVATYLSGAVTTFALFLLMRALTGLGEGTYYGSQYGISSNITPKKYRGLVSALINSGMALGISLGLIAASYFTYTLDKGWQFSFYLFAIPTVIVAILIGVFVRDGNKEEKVSTAVPTENVSLKQLFTKNHICVYIIIFCSLYGFFGMLTWLPYYLQTARGVDGSQTGIIASLVPWASIPGAIFFGYISDRVKSKKPLIISLAVAGAFLQIVIPYTESYSLLLTGLVLYGLLGKLALDPVLISYIADITPASMYSKVYGFFNFSGMLSSIFAPYITGYFADRTGSLELGFYLSGALLLVGAVAFLFTDKGPKESPVSPLAVKKNYKSGEENLI